jgi:hypothetical protein
MWISCQVESPSALSMALAEPCASTWNISVPAAALRTGQLWVEATIRPRTARFALRRQDEVLRALSVVVAPATLRPSRHAEIAFRPRAGYLIP